MNNKTIRDIMQLTPVIPVLVIDQLAHAVPLAHALVAGGLRVLEVTLRTPDALAAMAAIAQQVPEAVVGVGSVVRPEQFAAAKSAGAVFAVTPGLSVELAEAAQASNLPLLPGVMTPSEIVAALRMGYDALKFFPAQAAGGTAMLRAFSGPFPDVVFCPTGGVTQANAADYLSLPNVLCVGGSWLCPDDAIRNEQWPSITALARTSAALAKR